MYRVYADTKLLWDSRYSALDQYLIDNPSLTMEINRAGSLTFNITSANPLYDSLKNMWTVIVVFKDDVEIWRGRILSQEDDFYKVRTVTCEGELAYLNDIYGIKYTESTERTPLGYLNDIINHYRKWALLSRRNLAVGNVTGFGSRTTRRVLEQDHTLSEELMSRVIDIFGGFLRVRHSNSGALDDVGYIDYYATASDQSVQTIVFGTNMLDYVHTRDGSGIYTAIMPVGQNDTYISDVNNGNYIYTDDKLLKQYGRIIAHVNFDTKDKRQLLSLGKQWLANNHSDIDTFEISAVDMNMLGVKADDINIGDMVRVMAKPYNMDSYYQCTKIEYTLDDPTDIKYTLGSIGATITSGVSSAIGGGTTGGGTSSSTVDAITQAVMANIASNYATKAELQQYALSSVVDTLRDRIVKLEARVTALEKKVDSSS